MSSDALGGRRAQSEEYNFIPFSRDGAYREANRELILKALSYLPSRFFQVDVASGTGLVPQEVGSLCREKGRMATVIGIDNDRFAIESARENTPSFPHCAVEFVEGRAQDMDQLLDGRMPPGGVDYVSIHDAIHEIEGEEDKRSVLSAIARILRPGGIFTYNSAFTTAGMEVAAMKWGRWKAKAFSILGGKRDRRSVTTRIHSPDEYKQMILSAGLAVIYEAKRVVNMSRDALAAIACYPAFVEGVFGDMAGKERIPFDKKSRALIDALDIRGITGIPRVWHEIVAQKRAQPVLLDG